MFRALLLASAVALLSGCASFVAPSYSADYAAVDTLKRSPLVKVSLDKVEPKDANAQVNKVTLRGAHLTAGDVTFAEYVGQALKSDLQDAGLYDTSSKRKIDVLLLKNSIDISGFSTGAGEIEIELSMSEAGKSLLKKNYSSKTSFESSFAGAVAIPKGQAAYPDLVRSLLAQIYRDPAFLRAMSRNQ